MNRKCVYCGREYVTETVLIFFLDIGLEVASLCHLEDFEVMDSSANFYSGIHIETGARILIGLHHVVSIREVKRGDVHLGASKLVKPGSLN